VEDAAARGRRRCTCAAGAIDLLQLTTSSTADMSEVLPPPSFDEPITIDGWLEIDARAWASPGAHL